MSQIGRFACVGSRALYGVAHHARRSQKDLLALSAQGVGRCRSRRYLRLLPSIEVRGWFRRDDQCHIGVLIAAEFSALSAIRSRAIGTQLNDRIATRNHILLAVQIRDPEAVD